MFAVDSGGSKRAKNPDGMWKTARLRKDVKYTKIVQNSMTKGSRKEEEQATVTLPSWPGDFN